jgi:hypothetical protein
MIHRRAPAALKRDSLVQLLASRWQQRAHVKRGGKEWPPVLEHKLARRRDWLAAVIQCK